MGDEEKDGPGTATIITRTIEAASPLVVKLAPYIIPILLGGSAGVASHRVTDAQEVATSEEARDRSLKNEAALKKEQDDRKAEREASRKQRDAQIRALEDRVLRLEILLKAERGGE